MPAGYVAAAGAVLGAVGSMQDKETKSEGQSYGTSTMKKTSELNLMDKLSKEQLDRLTGQLSGIVSGRQPFDREAAAAQAQGVVKSIFDSYQKTALPQIANMGNRGGSYDSTSQQLMANDAFAQAVNKASETVLATVQKEQQFKMQQDQSDMQALLNALGLQAQVTQRSKTKATETTMGQTSGTATVPGENWMSALGGALMGGATAYTANQP